MKKLILSALIILSAFISKAQTYNPSQATTSNKPYGAAQAIPTDARSFFYDATNFLWRPYQSTAEVISYLNLSKYRVGNYSIFVNSGGTLNPNGTFSGGVILEYWFKDGQADGNLVLKNSGACVGCLLSGIIS